MNNKLVYLIVIIVFVIAGFAYFTRGSTSINQTDDTSVTERKDELMEEENDSDDKEEENDSDNAAKKPEIREVIVSSTNFQFDTKQIKVNKGDTVKITFMNTQGFHDFVIDEFNVRTKQLKEGDQEMIQFKANKTGSFKFYCSVNDHRAKGMEGSLVVE